MDYWVRESQRWVNANYRSVSGYQVIAEDGVTGWGTMYALTRALQHELGITALSNNFGDGTAAAYVSKVGALSASTKNSRLVGILQCALWCKGYSGDTEFGTWTTTVSSSVAAVTTALGLASLTIVDVKVMRSMLTLDAYVLVQGGTDVVRRAQQWLNGRYAARGGYRLVPCDGIYSRDVQYGFMLGVQYEMGMSDSTANGNFGPGTQAGLKAQAVVGPGAADASSKWVSLYQLALIFNGYSIGRTGTFDTATAETTSSFQTFMLLTVTRRGDFDTWAALLVSTGNPDRPVRGLDTTTKVDAVLARQLRSEGYDVIGRYLTVTSKSIDRGELDALFDAGFSVVPIMQNYNNAPEYFTEEIGSTQGWEAAMRARQLGFKAGTIIYFPVDYDAFGTEVDTSLAGYFRAVRRGLDLSVSVPYKIGVYATRNVADRIYRAGLADAIWVSGMSTGYSGNLGYPMPKGWSYNQIQELHARNLDRNAVSPSARPASRADVDLPPSSSAAIWQAQFDITKMQVLAERQAGDLGRAAAGYHVASFLMQKYYSEGMFAVAFHTYLPLPQSQSGPGAAAHRSIRSAIDDAFRDPRDVLINLPGDGAHMAATAQGVRVWGDHAGASTLEMGDLGGWGLDLATFWKKFTESGSSDLRGFIDAHFARPNDPNKFSESDLLADADGWLIGQRMRRGMHFDEAVRDVHRAAPTSKARLRSFLRSRFGSRAGFESAFRNTFVSSFFWTYPAVWFSIAPSTAPNEDQRRILASAAASIAFEKAGM